MRLLHTGTCGIPTRSDLLDGGHVNTAPGHATGCAARRWRKSLVTFGWLRLGLA